jgi:uncharacterized protein (TIGR02421 family)
MTATDLVRPEDLAIEHELADTASSIRFLLDVTPTNLIEARRRFLDDGITPTFTYSPVEDPAVIEARLAAVATDTDTVEDPAIAYLVQAKRREFELQLQMLRRRGTDEFLDLSLQLYGTVSPALVGDAESLLNQVPTPPAERGRRLGAKAFARRVEVELDHYRAHHVGLDVIVEIRHDSSGVMVSYGNVLIAPTVAVPEGRVNALLQHEIGTHVVTHVNGSHQPLRLLGAGLADYDETQEGLAVFAEYLAGGLTARRLRQLAARVVAVHQMAGGATFPEVHAGLVDCGVAAAEAFTITARVFRSGGLTKDAVYLRGLRNIISHVGAGGGLDGLWLGKMSLTDLPHIEDLRDRGILREPLVLPRYLADPAAQQRLAAVTASTTPIDLLMETT